MSIKETKHLLTSKTNADRLTKSVKQLKRNELIINEVEDMTKAKTKKTISGPKRYEVGYTFPIPVRIKDIDYDEDYDGVTQHIFCVEIECLNEGKSKGTYEEVWFTRKELIYLESKLNPSVVKEELERELEEAEKAVEEIKQRIKELK